jgi:hypothetical protein
VAPQRRMRGKVKTKEADEERRETAKRWRDSL